MRCPATSAISAARAMAATAQGRTPARPRSGGGPSPRQPPDRETAAPPTAALPQRWQNFAPGVSALPHIAQTAPSSGTPQLEQNRPVAGDEHPGQSAGAPGAARGGSNGDAELGGGGDVIAGNLHSIGTHRSALFTVDSVVQNRLGSEPP